MTHGLRIFKECIATIFTGPAFCSEYLPDLLQTLVVPQVPIELQLHLDVQPQANAGAHVVHGVFVG